MKKLCILLLIILTGCSSSKGLSNTQKKLGTSEVVAIPGKHYLYIARDKDNAIYYCESTGVGEEAECVMLLGGKKDMR